MTESRQIPREARLLTKRNIFSAKLATKVATWNVRTLFQAGNLAQVTREFKRYGLHILGISEARWTGSGRETCEGNTFIYSGQAEHHSRGVGLIINREAENALIGWKPVNDRIITARFLSRHVKTTIIQVYAPVEDAEEETKNAFYEQLQDVLNDIPRSDLKILMGDFNAQLGKQRSGFEDVIGPYGSARATNDNGERFISFCSENGFCIGNTLFKHKNIHKKTWRSPNGSVFNEIDYICISKRWRSALQDVRTFRGADVGTDHYLVGGKLKLKLKKVDKKAIIKPYDVKKLQEQSKRQELELEINNRFQLLQDEVENDTEHQWNIFKEVTQGAADKVLGPRRGTKKKGWIKDETWALIDERKDLKRRKDQANTGEDRRILSVEYSRLHRSVKMSCRKDRKTWIEEKCQEAQDAINRGDTRTPYRIAKELGGSTTSSGVPVKDKNGKLLQTETEQNDRWVEHFKETLNQPEPVELLAFHEGENIPELNVNTDQISTWEVENSIRKLKNNKSAGMDRIPAELLKSGGSILKNKLQMLCNSCWERKSVPQDWKKGAIIKLPKKGVLCDCGNWRGITLLSVPGKVLCVILLHRLKEAVDLIMREEQAGFRAQRSCTDQIFVLRNIVEQCLEFQKPVFINFIDFKKAFDSVHRDSLWKILKIYGIPGSFISIFKDLYDGSSCCVKVDEGYTEFFDIVTGVRQGCVLSPLLFTLTIDYVMRISMVEPTYGLPWTKERRLKDLDFADDLALLAESWQQLQQMTTSLEENAAKVGLKISGSKTKTMQIGDQQSLTSVPIIISGEPVEKVNKFTYLGSMFTEDGDIEADIKTRLGKASAVFRRMLSIWKSGTITRRLKVKLFETIVLPTALYGSETWKMSVKMSKRIDAFQQRCLRKILKVTYRDRITNEEIYRRTSTRPLCETIEIKRMKYAGHVLRMPAERDPKIAFKWQPDGRRRRGRPRATWRRTFQKDLEVRNINLRDVGDIAQDRLEWRKLAARCAQQRGRN